MSAADADRRPLSYGRQTIEAEDVAAVERALRGDWLTQGPTIEAFESALCGHFGATHAVAVANGTAALHVAALACDLAPGDRVLVPTLTFLASANCIRYCGATPVFVDVDPATLNLDLDAVERLLDDPAAREGVRGVVAVHFAGLPVDMPRLVELCDRHGLFLIEDASHAMGARWRDRDGEWRTVGDGRRSTMTTFSFHPVKHLTTGEGGAVLTDDAALAERLRSLRSHGVVRDPDRFRLEPAGPWHHEMHELGYNYRITDLQCALGIAQLTRLDAWLARRHELVANYRARLAGHPGICWVEESDDRRPAWHLFVGLFEGPATRKHVWDRLREEAIFTQVHYIPVHLQPYYRELLGTKEGDFPNAEAAYARCLSLPLYPTMTDDDLERVVDALKRALA